MLNASANYDMAIDSSPSQTLGEIRKASQFPDGSLAGRWPQHLPPAPRGGGS
jgi:hypothetical protein